MHRGSPHSANPRYALLNIDEPGREPGREFKGKIIGWAEARLRAVVLVTLNFCTCTYKTVPDLLAPCNVHKPSVCVRAYTMGVNVRSSCVSVATPPPPAL